MISSNPFFSISQILFLIELDTGASINDVDIYLVYTWCTYCSKNSPELLQLCLVFIVNKTELYRGEEFVPSRTTKLASGKIEIWIKVVLS